MLKAAVSFLILFIIVMIGLQVFSSLKTGEKLKLAKSVLYILAVCVLVVAVLFFVVLLF